MTSSDQQYGVPTVIAAIAVLIIFGMTCHFVGARRRARFTLQHLLQRELEAAERRRGEIGLGEKPKMYGVYLDGTEVMENFAMKDIQVSSGCNTITKSACVHECSRTRLASISYLPEAARCAPSLRNEEGNHRRSAHCSKPQPALTLASGCARGRDRAVRVVTSVVS